MGRLIDKLISRLVIIKRIGGKVFIPFGGAVAVQRKGCDCIEGGPWPDMLNYSDKAEKDEI